MDTHFIGEHLGPGQLGHFFAITSFVAALLSMFSYWRAVGTEQNAANSRTWKLMGRGSFILNMLAVIGIFSALYYIIANHLFEYHYAWEHSSRELPTKYLLSCFWEGQEGSFMLWTFWNCVLGVVVMNTAKILETRVMTIISLVQVCLATMILGIYLTPDIHMGSNPFALLRTTMQGAPIFAMPNYMSFIKDGTGLNVLLQNYWMVIHPPVLFMGFASTLIPFAYSVAALWKGDYTSFVKPALAWSLFSGAVLGTGIMMGGAWAYESLSFGGYWAWDPVENASLVPWMVLIGGLHTLLVYKATKRSLLTTFILLLLAHLLVWYSTFLTRTGVLGNTSVHAFTGAGKSLYWHLLIVLGILLALAVAMLIKRWKSIPRIKTEESLSSREFWMFIGSIVLLLAALQIIFATSLPIWAPVAKWITGKDIAPPVDPVTQYNNVQVWVAIIVGLLSATILYLKYKNTGGNKAAKRLLVTGVIALVAAIAIGFGERINAWQYDIMLFASCYGIIANIYYGIAIQKAKLRKLGPSVAHLGFATILLGVLLSSFKKEVISYNTLGVVLELGKKTPQENAKESRENVVLFRNTPVVIGDYVATYRGDSTSQKDARTFYRVDYEHRDSATHKVLERFTLYPTAFVNPKGQQGLIANPASKHYWNRDIFTYITSLYQMNSEDTSQYKSYTVHKGDSIFVNDGFMVFNGFSTQINDPRYNAAPGDIAVAANITVYKLDSMVKNISPIYYIRDQYEHTIDDTLSSMGLYTQFAKVLPNENAAEIKVRQTSAKDDYITLKAILFPYINVLWLGVVVMVIGFLISLISLLLNGKNKENVTADA